MARVTQYPHFLFVATPGASRQDENGNWVDDATASVNFVGMCREEAEGRGMEVQTADGTYHRVTSTVYCPQGTAHIAIGTMCIVANDRDCMDVRHKAKCLRCDPSQLHCRVWL